MPLQLSSVLSRNFQDNQEDYGVKSTFRGWELGVLQWVTPWGSTGWPPRGPSSKPTSQWHLMSNDGPKSKTASSPAVAKRIWCPWLPVTQTWPGCFTHLTSTFTLNALHFSKSSLTRKCPRVSLLCNSQRGLNSRLLPNERDESAGVDLFLWNVRFQVWVSSMLGCLVRVCVRRALDKHRACSRNERCTRIPQSQDREPELPSHMGNKSYFAQNKALELGYFLFLLSYLCASKNPQEKNLHAANPLLSVKCSECRSGHWIHRYFPPMLGCPG